MRVVYRRSDRGRTWQQLLAFLGFSFLLCSGCSNQHLSPVAPKWDADFTLPLANRLYTLEDIVEKNPGSLSSGSGNQIVYSASSQSDPAAIGDLLTLSPTPSTQRVKLGAFSVMFPPFVFPVQVPWLPPGGIVQIPDSTIAFGDFSSPVGTFQSITVNSGTVTLTIRNHLPVPVRVADSVFLFSDAAPVALFLYTGHDIIPAGDSASATSDLAGKTVDNAISLSGLAIHLTASGQPVSLPLGSLFDLELTTAKLEVSRAVTAVVPAQRLTDNDTTRLALDDSTIVKYALLRAGSVNLAFTNNISLNILFKFRFAEVRRKVGGSFVPYEDSIFIPAGSMLTRVADLSGCEIASLTGGLIDSLQTISSVIIPTASSNVTVNDSDHVVVTMTRNTPIIADTVAAVLKPTSLAVNTWVRMNLGDATSKFNGQLNIPSASLNLALLSSIGSPMDLSLQLRARNAASGRTAILDFPASQKRVLPGTTTVEFDSTQVGAFLSTLSGALPDSLQILGTVLVNPPDVYSRSLAGVRYVGRNSSVGADMDLDIPLRLGIVGTASYADTVSLSDSTSSGYHDFIDNIHTDQFKSGSVSMEVENGTAVQVDVALGWLDGSRKPLVVLPGNRDTLHVAPASVDANGNVGLPAQSTMVVQLDSLEVKQFGDAQYFSKAVMLMTTSGGVVRFRTSDYVRVKIWSHFTSAVSK